MHFLTKANGRRRSSMEHRDRLTTPGDRLKTVRRCVDVDENVVSAGRTGPGINQQTCIGRIPERALASPEDTSQVNVNQYIALISPTTQIRDFPTVEKCFPVSPCCQIA